VSDVNLVVGAHARRAAGIYPVENPVATAEPLHKEA
jgi:hypothetical protein